MVDRALESKIRKRFDELYNDLKQADYDAEDVQEVLDRLEDQLLEELDEFEQEDDDEDED